MIHKVFIDIGSHIGQSIDRFYQEIDDAADWDMYCFEPIQFRRLKERLDEHHNIKFIEAAVGITNGKVMIYSVPKGGQGSTIMKGKSTGDVNYKDGKFVDYIDFIEWFKHNTDVEDFIIIKINIEGGEYVLMPRLFEIMSRVNGLYIKLHHHKFIENQKSKLLKIYEDFKRQIAKYKTFVFCDTSEDEYKFKWMLNKIHGG